MVTYPYEWPFAMLRDAAALHLEILLAALDEGFSTKDGSAFNLQFDGVRPVFIDVGSFERVTGPWPGYRQFCRTLLFPLMIQAHLGIAYQPFLRGSVDGLLPTDVAAMFGGRRKWKKGVLRNVVLHGALERRALSSRSGRSSRSGSEEVKAELRRSGFGAELAKAMAKKLLKLVRGLDAPRRRSTWDDYRDTCSYSTADAAAKRAFVERALADHSAGTVIDLGANDGEYSLLAAQHAERVVAVDADETVIDALYRRLRSEDVTNVLPMVMNLVDPSPAIGWRNAERSSFADRVDGDVVLALALVHHLVIGANIPMPQVVDWLRGFGARLVVELVHPDDPMARRLMADKPAGLFDDYRVDAFESLLDSAFRLVEFEVLPGGTRTIYLAEPRA
ncbi:MAG: methyltransferase-like protein 9 [Acidimicrobiia bacterium]|nr:methyltransferase-like protein 9 [Acidimicrobiia bacterium]